jgi:hypothetical protein
LRVIFQLGIPCRELVTNPCEKYNLTEVRETTINVHTIEYVLWRNERKVSERAKRNVCAIVIFISSVALALKRTIPTESPPLVDEVSANFCG